MKKNKGKHCDKFINTSNDKTHYKTYAIIEFCTPNNLVFYIQTIIQDLLTKAKIGSKHSKLTFANYFSPYSTRNLVLCNHSICNYMRLFVICSLCLDFLQLITIFFF